VAPRAPLASPLARQKPVPVGDDTGPPAAHHRCHGTNDVSMAFSEGLSDTGDLTGRGRPYLRGAITGAGTFLGGVLHTLPFLIPQYRPAVLVALAAIAFELLALAWIRRRFFGTGFLSSLVSVTLGGAIIAAISAALGAVR
jgi:hypothetical protein